MMPQDGPRVTYTDEDLRSAAEAVLDHGAWDPALASTGHECIARDVLSAVASTIAARAFAVGYIEGVSWDGWIPSDEQASAAAREWLDEIESGL